MGCSEIQSGNDGCVGINPFGWIGAYRWFYNWATIDLYNGTCFCGSDIRFQGSFQDWFFRGVYLFLLIHASCYPIEWCIEG